MVRLWSSSHPHPRTQGGNPLQSEDDAEREKEQEKLIKLGEQILKKKIGETEFKEVRTLALDPPSVRDGPPSSEKASKQIHLTSLKLTTGDDTIDDDNFSQNSDESCPARWRSASEDENILGTRKDYEANLAEAMRRKKLNEVNNDIAGSTNLNFANQIFKPTTSLSSLPTTNASDRANDKDTKQKGKWNGWFHKKANDKITKKSSKLTRGNKNSQSNSASTGDIANQEENKITNSLVPQEERKTSLNLRISTNDAVPSFSDTTGREGSAPNTPKEITPGCVKRQRELFEANMNAAENRTFQGDPSPRNTNDAGRQILIHSTRKTERAHTETKDNNNFSLEPVSVQSNTDWTPVDPEADLNPSSNLASSGKIPQRWESKRYDRHAESVPRSRESDPVESYYESLAKIGKTSTLGSTSKYQVHHTIAERSKKSPSRQNTVKNFTESADEADGLSDDWVGGAKSNISFYRPMANNDLAVATSREPSDDWSQSLSLNTLEKNVAKQFDGLKSWFSSLGAPSAKPTDPSEGTKTVKKTNENMDETKEQDNRTRSETSENKNPTMPDDQGDSVSKREKELSTELAGKSVAEAHDCQSDVKDGPVSKPSMPELVTVSSIEIPAIEVEELADEEYSISILGLDKKHRGEHREELSEHDVQSTQTEDECDDGRQHTYSDHRDGVESIPEITERRDRSVSYADDNYMQSHHKTNRSSSRTGHERHTESEIEVAGKKVPRSRSRSRSRVRSRSRSKSRAAEVRIGKSQSARSRSRLRHRARTQNAARYVTSVSDLPAATELSQKKKKKHNEKKKQKAQFQTNTRRAHSTSASSGLDRKKKKKTTTSSSSRSASRSRTSSSRM